jgi:hypothetical protein
MTTNYSGAAPGGGGYGGVGSTVSVKGSCKCGHPKNEHIQLGACCKRTGRNQLCACPFYQDEYDPRVRVGKPA